ncbi:hypothetical protein J6590_077394 [Homalodisca vitripennis]|nr:hypothetical protein J6590_077394 [Homalodisca vitripennis]
MGLTSRVCQSTCVFESDFGFTLNCAFKKSGIFRVRNLGGVKGYVGLGKLIRVIWTRLDTFSANSETILRQSVRLSAVLALTWRGCGPVLPNIGLSVPPRCDGDLQPKIWLKMDVVLSFVIQKLCGSSPKTFSRRSTGITNS